MAKKTVYSFDEVRELVEFAQKYGDVYHHLSTLNARLRSEVIGMQTLSEVSRGYVEEMRAFAERLEKYAEFFSLETKDFRGAVNELEYLVGYHVHELIADHLSVERAH